IDAAKDRARGAVDHIADELVRISREIHAHPELAFKEHHAVSQLVPFVKTPWNIAAQGIERTPLGLKAVIDDAKAGRVGPATDKAARVVFGTMVGALGYGLAENGVLTGGPPPGDDERSTLPTGWKPWSVRSTIGGTTYYTPIVFMGNLGVPLAIGATLSDLRKHGVTGTTDQVMQSVVAIGRYMQDQASLQGFANLIKVMEDPERRAENLAEGVGGQFMLYGGLQRQLQRVLNMPSRDPQGVLEALLAISPITAGAV
ncbi:MAG: hypothetical protein AAB262_04240, partial [Elusimicrobiota bacterium]